VKRKQYREKGIKEIRSREERERDEMREGVVEAVDKSGILADIQGKGI
jgi:hypothetical protein